MRASPSTCITKSSITCASTAPTSLPRLRPTTSRSSAWPSEAMRILVTGGAGFIGSEFVRSTLARYPSDEVTVLDRLTYAGNLANLSPVADDVRYRFFEGDIANRAAVERAIDGCEVVVNFAAETHVDRSILDPDAFVKTDVLGTWTLAQAARAVGIRRFLQISTDEVYGA